MPTRKDDQIEWIGNGTEPRFRRELTRWYNRHRRELPWRSNRLPYRVWVSEIMLQQTQVGSVIGYFKRFIRRFPNVQTLALADEADVLKMWEGLGYYRRARQMHAAAKEIVKKWNGRFPRSLDDALSLPGIGRYTAGAILSIAYDLPHPILEGNTIRLFARLLGIRTNARDKKVERQLWRFSEQLLPSGPGAGELNQALMELGSEVCRLRNPLCPSCPVREYCHAFAEGNQESIPLLSPRMKYESRRVALLILRRGSRYLVRKCTTGEHWSGLWDFPRIVLEHGPPNKMTGLSARQLSVLNSRLVAEFGLSAELRSTGIRIKHAVTKYRITLDCYRGDKVSGKLLPGKNCAWVAEQELERLALNSTGRRIANWVVAEK